MSNTPVQQIKELLHLAEFDGYNGLVEPIRTLVKERDESMVLADRMAHLLDDCKRASSEFIKTPQDNADVGYMTAEDIPRLVARYFGLRNAQATTRDKLIKALGYEGPHLDMDGLIERVADMRRERDESTKMGFMTTATLNLLGLENGFTPEQFHTAIGGLVGTINGLKQLLGLPETASNTALFQAVETLHFHEPDTTQRYILHDGIKPCTVLYSDHTTTLVRLPDEDMICETDTIEWADEITYRCQGLWVKTQLPDNYRITFARQLAQLVRDGHVILNEYAPERLVLNLDGLFTPPEGLADFEKRIAQGTDNA